MAEKEGEAVTLKELAGIITTADPDAKHYDATAAAREGLDFTVWMEYERIGLDADDAWAEQGWRFEVDRYTKTEYDPVADAIETALLNAPGVTCGHRVQYNGQSGYIRHIFEGEAV